LGESLPPGDSDWGNLTITSQQRIADEPKSTTGSWLDKADLWHYCQERNNEKDDHA